MEEVMYSPTMTNMHDAVVDGVLHKDIPTRLVFVSSTTERDALPNKTPGMIVALYGFGHVWQYDANNAGNWIQIK